MEVTINFTKTEDGGKWSALDPQNNQLEAYMSFNQKDSSTINIHTTKVPEDFSLKGTGKALLKMAISYMRENHLKTNPSCSFVLSQLKKYSEWNDVLDPSLL